MNSEPLLQETHDARTRAPGGSGKASLLGRFARALDALVDQAQAEETPEHTRAKIVGFLEHLERQHHELGARLFLPSYLLNVLGEGMVRGGLIHGEVVRTLQVGLYFFGLDQIERRWSSQAAVYAGLHADVLTEFLSRRGLKGMVADGRARLAEGRVFCLTYHYLNALRRAYWAHCRASQDALDMAITGGDELRELPTAEASPREAAATLDPGDRVGIMLDIFRRVLTPEQRWIYLAKNRESLVGPAGAAAGSPVERLLEALEGAPSDGNLGWTEIARRRGMNEKTAKREYLKALHMLLRHSSRVVFGPGWEPSGYVKRVLDQLRNVIDQKDLRIRSSTGRGLGTLVRKWEVALRYVLNHQKVSA